MMPRTSGGGTARFNVVEALVPSASTRSRMPPPLDVQLRERFLHRRLDRRDFVGAEIFLHRRARSLDRLFRRGFVDLLRLKRHIGEDRDRVTAYFDEAFPDREVFGPAAFGHPQRAG